MKVCVQGLWHLGTVTASCLASKGNVVVGLDFESATIDGLKQGVPPLFEPGLEDLVKDGISTGQLSFTADAEQAVKGIDVLWIAYDTPVDDDDNADIDFVVAQIEKTISHLPNGVMVLISSQMPVGSVKRLESIAKDRYPNKDIGFACSPENLRLGKALDVFLNPDRIVVGVRSANDREKLDRLLRPITDRIEWMSVESAEMTKHAINAFLATSVAFINELSGICDHYGADASEVEKGLKSDHRIGQQAYLRPGEAFAGGTLARDLKYLIRFGQEKKIPTSLFTGVVNSNDLHKKWARRKLTEALKTFKGKRVAILGLTYKPGTDTLRRSESIETARWLDERGAEVVAYDPAVKSLPGTLENVIHLCRGPDEALKGAHAVLIGTPWPEFKKLEAEEAMSLMEMPVVIDLGGFLFEIFENQHGIVYVTIGGSR